MALRINGRAIAKVIREQIKEEIAQLDITPGLAVFLVGDDPASHLYVSLKQKAAKEVGINFETFLYFSTTPQADIIAKINEVNLRDDIHGIIVQLPLPKPLDENAIILAIDPTKDVDGFHPDNIKKFLKGESNIVPGLALAIQKLIHSTNIPLKNKKAIIVAKSVIFAKPISKMLEDDGMMTSFVKPDDHDFKQKTRSADVLVVAVGRANLITAENIKQGVIIIDVGTNQVDDQVVGDVDYEGVANVASHVTPVPGGVGPMTVAMLLWNVLESYKRSH